MGCGLNGGNAFADVLAAVEIAEAAAEFLFKLRSCADFPFVGMAQRVEPVSEHMARQPYLTPTRLEIHFQSATVVAVSVGYERPIG